MRWKNVMMDGWLDGLSVTVTIIRQGLRTPFSFINQWCYCSYNYSLDYIN